jgi:hypothetical protein
MVVALRASYQIDPRKVLARGDFIGDIVEAASKGGLMCPAVIS